MPRRPTRKLPQPDQRRRLPFLGRLDRYVMGHFVWSYLTALLLVVGLFWILDLAANVDDYIEPGPDGEPAPTQAVALFYVYNLPYVFLQVAPFVTLLAGMFSVSRLLKKNEVVAALAAGISAHRLLFPVFVGGIVAAGLMFGAREWTSTYVAGRRDALRDSLENRRPRQIFRSLFAGDGKGGYMRAGYFLPAHGGEPAEIRGLEAEVRLEGILAEVTAERATWEAEQRSWVLEEGRRRMFRTGAEDPESEPAAELKGIDFEPVDFITMRRARDAPLELSFAEVRRLSRREPEDRTYQTLWQYHLTFPLANLILLMVGLPLLVRHERGGGAERMAMGGLLCVVYFAVDYVFRNLGLEASLSPLLASWIPILVFGSLGIVLVEGIRT